MLYTPLYIDYLRNNRNLSHWTIAGYSNALKFFDKYLKQSSNYSITVEDCEKITKLHIQNFMSNLILQGKNPRSVNIYLSGIKGYLGYCENILGKNVANTTYIQRMKEYHPQIEALSEYECMNLLEYFKDCIRYNDDVISRRNYCICYLLIYTGLRISELINLKRSQIGQSLVIRGKGNKNRTISLFDDDLCVINDYLKLRKDDVDWLFISFSHKHTLGQISIQYAEEIIREGGKKIGLKVFPHKLRHSFATNLLRNNAKLTHIQRLLGHNSLATTQIYLSVLDTELRDTQKLLHKF